MKELKVYTFLTESHRPFLDFFIKSFPFKENLKLEIDFFPQECPTAEYEKEGWEKTMYRKVKYIIDSLNFTPENEYFIHSDIDIQFFGDLKSDIEKIVTEQPNVEIFFQRDGKNYLCMGFFVCKKNINTLNFFKKVLNELHNFKNDQHAVNDLIKNENIIHDFLPERYFTIGVVNNFYTGNETSFYVPENLVMHHANFTVGVEKKIKLMNMIRETYVNQNLSRQSN